MKTAHELSFITKRNGVESAWSRSKALPCCRYWQPFKCRATHIACASKFHWTASHLAHFWSQFLTNFDVTPLKLKLRTSSTRIWKNFATRGPVRHLQMPKMCQKLQTLAHFCDFKASYRPPSGKVILCSCRGGPKLQFAWSYIKIGQVLRSEMKKFNQTTNAHISETKQDIKISSTYLESAANFTSDRCGFVIL